MTPAPRAATPRRLLVRAKGRISFVPVNEIDWIGSAGNYLRLHVGQNIHVMRGTMKDLESQLDPHEFLRIHRSTMVRIDRVRELKPSPTGEYVVLLQSGTELTLSRGYRGRLRNLLEAGRNAIVAFPSRTTRWP